MPESEANVTRYLHDEASGSRHGMDGNSCATCANLSFEVGDVIAALGWFDEVWSALFPAEQARIVKLLVERVTVPADGLAVDLRTDGLGAVVREMLAPKPEEGVA